MITSLFLKKDRLLSFLFLTLSFYYSAQNVLVGTGFNASWPSACNNVTPGTYFSAGAGTSYSSGALTPNGTGDQYWRLGIDWSGSVYQVNNGSSTDVSVSPNTTYTASLVCTNTGALKYNVANTSYRYVFKTKDAGVSPSGNWVFFEVQGAVQSVSSVTRSPSAVPATMPVTVTATTSGSVNSGQAVYLRYTTNAWSTSTVVQMTGSGTTYTASIPGQAASTAVQYYVFTSGTANVASNGSNADLYTINLNNNSGSNYSYTVGASAFNVWVTSTTGTTSAGYSTLKGAIDAINAGTHTGAIEVAINNSTSETATSVLNSSGAGSASYTSIRIYPSADGLTVSGASATGRGLIELNGADNVTIDGDNPNTSGTNRNLTITNTATSTVAYSSVIRLATSTAVTSTDNVTIKNCILNGNATGRNISTATSTTGSENASFVIYAGGNGGSTATTAPTAIASVTSVTSASGQTFANLTLSNNSINQAARGIVLNGAAATVFNNPSVNNNTIGATGTTPSTTVYTKGIYIQGATAPSIANNTIQSVHSYVGTLITGIELYDIIATTASISKNSVSNVIQNGSGNSNNVVGIYIGSNAAIAATTTTSGNTITGVQGYSTTSAGTPVTGITYNSSATSGLIEKNIISTIYNNSTSTYGVHGITLIGGNAVTVQNNFVRDVTHNMTGGAAFSYYYSPVGILVYGGTGHKIYHNSVNLSGLMPGTATSSLSSFALAVNTSNNDIRNNILSNTITGGTTSISHSSLFLGSSVTGTTLNNNAYYSGTDTARQGILQVGTTAGSGFYLAANFSTSATTPTTNSRAYTTTIGSTTNDNASYASTNAAPFTSATDLHLNSGSTEIANVESKGANLSVTTDIDGDARGTTPDMGADEITIPPVANDAGIFAIPVSGITCPGTRNVTVTLKNYGTSTLTSANITWSVNGGASSVYNWSGSLASGATLDVVVGTFNFIGYSFAITAATSLPNGVTDGKPSNDSNTSATFQTSLSGTYTVGVGKDFATLTAAVAAANTNGLCGATVFSLTDTTYSASETFPITINSLTGASATNTLTIKPATGVSPTISGSSTAAIIKLNGADYVIIDGSNTAGGTTKNLTISNGSSGTSSSVVWIATASASNGATYNTIKNTIVSGNSRTTTAAAIGSSSTADINTASETDNAYNTVQNCTITGALYGISNYGNAASLDTGWTIIGNTIGSATNNRAHVIGIDLYNAKDFSVSNNTIAGVFATNANSTSVLGIEAYGTISNGAIFGNTISNVTNNDNSTGYAGTGIYLGATNSASNVSVYNNFIYDVKGVGFTGYFAAIGIWAGSGGGYNIYHNTVSINSSTQTEATAANTALLVSSGVTNMDVRNNIFYNYATTGNKYSVYSLAANTAYTNINYNDYYSVGAIGYLGGTQTTLANWQTATGKDANSINVVPPFVSASNLHITAGCTSLESGGTPIATVTKDIDSETRSTTAPDIGADEFSGSLPPKITSVTNGENCGTGSVLLTATSTDPGVTGYNWYTTSTGGTAVNGATPTSSNWTTPTLSATTNYYVAAYNGSCESDYRFLVTATIKPAPTDITAITETQKSSTAITSACDVDYVELKATGGLVTDSSQYAFGTQAAQNNTTTSSAYPAPYTVYYGGQRMQMLILASELTSAGFVAGSKINNIQFPVVSLGSNWGSTVTSCNSFQVSIGATALTTLSAFQTGLTQVVAPANFTPTVGYTNTHTFSSPFVWNGTSNIIIETTFSNNITGVSANTVTQYNSPTSYQSTIVYRADGVTASAAASATTVTYSYSARPDFKLNGSTDTQKVTWSPTAGLYSDTALTIPYNGTDYLATVYAAPGTATIYTAKASIGTCDKTKVTTSIVRVKNQYVGAGTDWNTASNWFPNVVPDANKCANIPAGKTVVIASDALAKAVTIADTGKLTINSNKSLTVTDAINISNNLANDNLVMESDASLMQVNNVLNTGNIYVKRDVKMRKMDYTFWSAPVTGQVLRNTSSSTGSTNTGLYDTGGFSGGTPNNRIYQYNEPNDLFLATNDANFVPGKAYAIRGKDSYYSGTDPLILTTDNTLKFIGVPNNGNSISVSIQKSKNTGTGGTVEHGYNLIGNPYPSNLDFISFYNFDQGGGIYNRSNIYGKAWFWTNTSPKIKQDGSNYTGSNYAVLSLAGAVAATGVDSGSTTGSPTPTQYIKVGQGFIVQMKGTAPTGTTPNTATLKFDNTMRSNAAGVFYNNNKTSTVKDRYWLKLVSPENVSNMILLAHLPETTNNYDADYDADLLTIGDDSFYSKLNTQKLQIQARAILNEQDVIPLGVKYSMNGTYKIILSDKEGVFASGQSIYLHDKLSNTYTDLTQSGYSFQGSKGLDETRFEIVYKQSSVLGAGDAAKSEFIVYRDGSDYVVRSSKHLGKIEMYDTSGKLLKTLKTDDTVMKINMTGIVEGVYILKVENSGEVKTHKIIK
ncbi:T9SS type A sorting domain-containing protein [Epilithonimonas sp.]|uniref:Ig-like domain-containing protein n=1 Tax=Epilithonimonas sp. TaxID=2894511 RepID=UPI0035B30529